MTSTLKPAVRPSVDRDTTLSHQEGVLETRSDHTPSLGRWLAVARIALGLVFLWAFVDKTFGLGYATPTARAWIHGGSPTTGFLRASEAGPFRNFFHALAGSAVVDWVFMIGLLGIGLALVLGVARWATVAAAGLMLMAMWAAEWPLALHTATGAATGSTNPLIDYHLIYTIVIIALAVAGAGATWGLAHRWERTALVRRWSWLR
jgi:thiosulfate dehydrogenase [quinone] large subunit